MSVASSKHWALYATKRRAGTWREHRLAGARIGQLGVRLSWDVLHGWRAEAHTGRVGFQFMVGPNHDDPRVVESLNHFFSSAGHGEA